MTQLCVVAICKNEEKNITQWLNHVKHADKICVVDTGSTDNTQDLLMKACETMPNLSILYDASPERNLAESRNLASSECGPNDLLVWLDIDERFSKEGSLWVRDLKEAFLDEVSQGLSGLYIKMHNGDNIYPQLKAYVNSKYKWQYRAHEVLIAVPQTGTYQAPVHAFYTIHSPDLTKPRNYTQELALDFRDNPRDTRVMFYYARELFYNVIYNRVDNVLDHYSEATKLFERMTQMECWKDYRCLLAQDYMRAAYMVEDIDGSIFAGHTAIAARPDRVESYGTFADLMQMCGDNVTALSLAIQGLAKTNSHNLLFDSWIPNMDLCYDVAIKSCQALNMDNMVLYYTAAKKQYIEDTSEEE